MTMAMMASSGENRASRAAEATTSKTRPAKVWRCERAGPDAVAGSLARGLVAHAHHRHLEQTEEQPRGLQLAHESTAHKDLGTAGATGGDEVEGGLVADRGTVDEHLARSRLRLRQGGKQGGFSVVAVAALVPRQKRPHAAVSSQLLESAHEHVAVGGIPDDDRGARTLCDVAPVQPVEQPQPRNEREREEERERGEHREPRLRDDGGLEGEGDGGGDDDGDERALEQLKRRAGVEIPKPRACKDRSTRSRREWR